MRVQVCPWIEQLVIVLQIKMVSLEIHENKDGRDGRWKLTKRSINVLRLQGYAFPEVLIMD